SEEPEITDLNTTYRPNNLQKQLKLAWNECIDDLIQKPTLLVVNGEPCDGGNKKGLGQQSWTTNFNDQLTDSGICLKEKPYQYLLFVRGSGYHVTVDGTNFEEMSVWINTHLNM
ncbi:hypothetical protein LCGC14_2331040, partial [marine sediment metagenome]